MVESAIRDANINVNKNDLSGKCAFICGRAEDKIAEICQTSAEVLFSVFWQRLAMKRRNS